MLHLAPANLSGYEVCPSRSPGCTSACLHHAGNPVFKSAKDKARIARTKFFFEDREGFLAQLRKEISRYKPDAVRLNGTSDMAWERIRGEFGTIIEAFPQVQFYDYTAVANRLRRPLPDNYHLTFSLKEDNLIEAKEALRLGFNIAAVFYDDLPKDFMGLPVIDGDVHDYRPSDPNPCVVGLKVKGAKGKSDETGFILREKSLLLAA